MKVNANLVLCVLVLLYLDSNFAQTRGLKNYATIHGEIGAGNFTYYHLKEEGDITLVLQSNEGDADLYVAESKDKVDFENYDLCSTSCGLDSVLVPATFIRPVYFGICGHIHSPKSKYTLIALVNRTLEDASLENILEDNSTESTDLWDLANEMKWPTPDDKDLYKNFLVADFLESSKEVPQRKCILVQVRQEYTETDWYLKLAEDNDFIVGVVGWVDLKNKDGKLKEHLQRYKKNPYFCGVRHVVQDEPDDEWLLEGDVLKGLAILEEMEVTYDLLILEKHMKVAEQIVQKFPKLTFVVDHLAKPSIDKNDLEHWTTNMKRLASYANVHCKMSGLGVLADQSQCLKTQIEPYIKRTIELFGSERCLFGSDWPVCLPSISYEAWYHLVKSSIDYLPIEQQSNVWHKTAGKVYSPKV